VFSYSLSFENSAVVTHTETTVWDDVVYWQHVKILDLISHNLSNGTFRFGHHIPEKEWAIFCTSLGMKIVCWLAVVSYLGNILVLSCLQYL
jgi:hypothetical protein